MCLRDTPKSDNGRSLRNKDEGTERLMMAGDWGYEHFSPILVLYQERPASSKLS
jgi:hypothetical protein